MSNSQITINNQNGSVFFNVIGDSMKYFDITSLENAHPELTDFIALNKYDLERKLYQMREVLNAYISA